MDTYDIIPMSEELGPAPDCRAAWLNEQDFLIRTRIDAYMAADSVFPQHSLTHLYFIEQAPDGPVKIGVAKDPYDRLTTLQQASPDRLKLLSYSRGTMALERWLHGILAGDRIRGEWFRRTDAVLALAEEFRGIEEICRTTEHYYGTLDSGDVREAFVGIVEEAIRLQQIPQ